MAVAFSLAQAASSVEPAFGAPRGRSDAAPAQAAELSARGLWKVYGPSRAEFTRAGGASLDADAMARRGWTCAMRDVSLDIAKGETFVVMGLSGSGKSTLVRCLSRLVEPTHGELAFHGRDLLAMPERELVEIRRRKMGMVFQNFALLPNRTVLGNVAFPLEIQGVPRAERERRAAAMITLVGLEGREERFPAELSGGQQQRVGIARSLAVDPELWFLDEPFSALDPLIRADLQDELLRLQRELAKTVVFITHDLDEAIRIADRIAIMEAGRVVQVAAPDELVLSPASDYVRRFTAKVPLAKVMRVRRLAEPDSAVPGEAQAVDAEATVQEAAAQVVGSEGPLIAVDRKGQPVGRISRERVIAVLAGIETVGSRG